jgi:hypothetical protein
MKSSLYSVLVTSGLFAVSMVFAADSGVIAGKVTLNGKAPNEVTVKMDADPKCHAVHTTPIATRHYVTDASGGLANVFVYVKEGLAGKKFPPKTESILLDQSGCLYQPYVLGIQAGQTLVIQNSDDTSHNVHSISTKNPEFNLAQPIKGMKTEKKFMKPEVFVKMKCDVHPWMFAYVGVVDHPFFAVTGADGSYKISGLPEGNYTLAAIHPKAGSLPDQKIKAAATGEAKADFTVTPKAQ